MHENEF